MSIQKIIKDTNKPKRFQKLKKSDVKNLSAFKEWIFNNLDTFYLNDKSSIKYSHLLTFVEYISDQVLKSKEIENTSKIDWISDLKGIKNTIEVLDKKEKDKKES